MDITTGAYTFPARQLIDDDEDVFSKLHERQLVWLGRASQLAYPETMNDLHNFVLYGMTREEFETLMFFSDKVPLDWQVAWVERQSRRRSVSEEL